MSFFNRSRGRHRAAGKLSTSMTRSMQATAAIAAAGGIAATAGASSASATGAASFVQPATPAAAAQPANPVTERALTSVAARPHLDVVFAKSLAASAQRPAQSDASQQAAASSTTRASDRSTSRSAQRPATTTRSTTAATSPRSTSGFTGGSTASTPTRSTTPTTTPSAPSSASGIVAIAQRYLGVPYVWGGTSPGGFDCSGLTQYVYAQAGISIPRTAQAQVAAMRHVSNPQPGDLVVFGSPATHIGIYVGPGQMIAAPRPGTVVKLQPIYATPTGYLRA